MQKDKDNKPKDAESMEELRARQDEDEVISLDLDALQSVSGGVYFDRLGVCYDRVGDSYYKRWQIMVPHP